jgi:endonuclease/exonuclease/phosphatase family metal-dependent hydrolase
MVASRLAVAWLLLAASACLAACSSTLGSSAPPAPSGSADDVAATPVPGPLTLRVMSYNLLWGGGFDRRFDANLLEWQKPLFAGRNRLPQILDLLESQAPDILALQEAAAWDEGDSPLAQDVAARLGMSYVMSQNEYEIKAALFSRYRILAWRDLSPYMGSNSALVAIVETADRRPLVVAVAHLDPFTSRMRSCQVELILSVLDHFAGGRVLLLGDMNFRPNSAEFGLLQNKGWEALAIEPAIRIDHIWASRGAVAANEAMWDEEERLGVVDGQRLSDHYPVGRLITFPEVPRAEIPREVPEPRARCEV